MGQRRKKKKQKPRVHASQKDASQRHQKPSDHGNSCPKSHPIASLVATETIVPVPPDKKTDSAKDGDQMPWYKEKNFILQVLIFVAGLYVAYIYKGQLDQMIKSNKIGRESIESVQRSFLTFKQIVGGPEYGPDGKTRQYHFTSEWENSGTTPAIRVINYFGIDEVRKDEVYKFPFTTPKGTEYWIGTTGPKATDTVGNRNEPDNFWVPAKNRNNEMYFWGYRIYRDVFPETPIHLTEFCAHLTNTFKTIPLGVPGSICASGGETNWNKRSGRWREARSIVQNRL
jgi:hypothetical protein